MKKILICIGVILGLVVLSLVTPMKNTQKGAEDIAGLFETFESEITAGMTLEELLKAFENMCAIPIHSVPQSEDVILFEVGTFSFTGDPMVDFSLTRQIPGPNGEFFQLNMRIQYIPNDTNRSLEECVWSYLIAENIFDYVRRSEAYQTFIHEPILRVEVHLDET